MYNLYRRKKYPPLKKFEKWAKKHERLKGHYPRLTKFLGAKFCKYCLLNRKSVGEGYVCF